MCFDYVAEKPELLALLRTIATNDEEVRRWARPNRLPGIDVVSRAYDIAFEYKDRGPAYMELLEALTDMLQDD